MLIEEKSHLFCNRCMDYHNVLTSCPFCESEDTIHCYHWESNGLDWVGAYYNKGCTNWIKRGSKGYDSYNDDAHYFSIEGKHKLKYRFTYGNNIPTLNQNILEINGGPSSKTVEVTFNLIIPLDINLHKTNTDLQNITNNHAKFTVKATQNNSTLINNEVFETNNNGELSINIMPNDNNHDITVEIKEANAPTNYFAYGNTITIVYHFNGTNWVVSKVNGSSSSGGTFNVGTDKFNINETTIKIANRANPDIVLELQKINTAGASLTGATFTVSAKQDGVQNALTVNPSTLTPPNPARAVITPIKDTNVTVTIKEKAPADHLGIANDIVIIYKYNQTSERWEIDSVGNGYTLSNEQYVNDKDSFIINVGAQGATQCIFVITVKNRPVVAKFEFIKLDELTGKGIKGITFNIKIDNLAGGPSNITVPNTRDFDIATDADGKITLENLEFVLEGNKYKDIIMTLTEKQVIVDRNGLPTYRFLHGPIVVTFRYDETSHRAVISNCTFSNEDKDKITYEPTAGKLSVTAKDEPIMHLGGLVWLDTAKGGKPPTPVNGKIDADEEGVGGIELHLFKTIDGGRTVEEVTKSVYDRDLVMETFSEAGTITYTDKENNPKERKMQKGEYFFPDLPKLGDNGYYIIFYTYDGVNYIATVNGDHQKANEQKASENSKLQDIRIKFNDRLKIINYGKKLDEELRIGNGSIAGDSVITTERVGKTLNYNYIDGPARSEAVLETTEENTDMMSGISVKNEFKIFSRTKDGYKDTDLDITFGIKSRGVDLSIQNDVSAADVQINNKTTRYNYGEIVSSNGKIIDKNINEEPVSYARGKYKLDLYKSDYENTTAPQLLKIHVTYAVRIYKEDIENLPEDENLTVTVNELTEYFDERYEKIVNVETEDGVKLDFANKGKATINGTRYNIATIKGKNGAPVATLGNSSLIYITFEVHGEGQEIDANGGLSINLNDYDTIVEIAEYQTEHGLVDRDSEPNNIASSTRNGKYEDDTDRAMGLVVDVPGRTPGNPERIRKISGNVWEDIKNRTGREGYKYGNGEKDEQEVSIKNIEVELIELVPNTSDSSGSRETEVVRQRTTTDENGNYSFQRMIPGDYKVRFTYKDEIYNGQDYKSGTVSENHYKEALGGDNSWYYNSLYNIAGSNSDGKITSKAIDDASIRLNLMAKYAKVNKETYIRNLNILTDNNGNNNTVVKEKDVMKVNTPKIYVSVDVKPNEFNDTDGTTAVKGTTVGETPVPVLEIGGVSLALEKRPETKLTIEEHIKRVAVRGNDDVAFVNAEVEDENGLFNNDTGEAVLNLKGVKDHLVATKSFRTERGAGVGNWRIIMETDQLLQGGSVESEVVYKVKNESETDYLSKGIIDDFNNNKIDDYIKKLQLLSNNKSAAIETIGITYFTGIINDTVSTVPTRIGKVQDYTTDLELKDSESLKVKELDKTYNKASDLIEVNLNYEIDGKKVYKEIFPLFDENKLMIDTRANTINTVVKYENTYYQVDKKQQPVRQVLTTEEIGSMQPGVDKSFKAIFGINGLTPAVGDLNFENFIAEIMDYGTPTGRLDRRAIPGNLEDKFVYSEDSGIELTANERDEYGGERIIIEPPTGEDKLNPTILVLAITAGIAVIAAGAYAVKKYVIK